jgi:chromosome segregation ATPase
MNYSTDLQVAQDLKKLSNIVNEAIERATKVLAEAKEIDGLPTLVKEIHTTRKSLELIQNRTQDLEQSATIRINQLSEEFNAYIQKIDEKINIYEQKISSADNILTELRSTLNEIGGMDEVRKLLTEVQDTRVQLREAKAQAIAVQSLELYLQEFQRHHQPHQLRHLLWKELGFVGIVVYFISLITRRK